jgi:serine/threonine protein kinase
MTKKGVVCKRTALPGSTLCAQHEKIQKQKKPKSSDLLWDTTKDDIPKLTKYLRTIPSLNKYYQVKEKFAHGTSGHVFEGIHLASNKPVALKVVVMDEHSMINGGAQPAKEAEILRHFTSCNIVAATSGGCQHHIVHLIDQFMDIPYGNDLWICILVMEKLDTNLALWAEKHDMKDDILRRHVQCQMVSMVQQLHSSHIVSNDIKPKNICIRDASSKFPEMVMIDLGSARLLSTDKFVMEGEAPGGTTQYASLRVSRNEGYGFADDLESVCFCIWELLSGSLPWNQLNNSKEKIIDMKANLKGCPTSLANVIKYSRSLGDNKLDYNHVFELLQIKPSCDQTRPNKKTFIEPTPELAFENGYTKDFMMSSFIQNNPRIEKILKENTNNRELIGMLMSSEDSIDTVTKLIKIGLTKPEANQVTEKLWARYRTYPYMAEKTFRPLL